MTWCLEMLPKMKVFLLVLLMTSSVITDSGDASLKSDPNECKDVSQSLTMCPSECCCREDFIGNRGGNPSLRGNGNTNATITKAEWTIDCSWRNLTRIPDNFPNNSIRM